NDDDLIYDCSAAFRCDRLTGQPSRIPGRARPALSRPDFFGSIADPSHPRVFRRGRSGDRRFTRGKTRGHLVSRIFFAGDRTWHLLKTRYAARPLDRRWSRPPASLSIAQARQRGCACLQFADRGAGLDAPFYHRARPRNLACLDAIVPQKTPRLRRRHDARSGIPSLPKHFNARWSHPPARAYDRGPLTVLMLVGTRMPSRIPWINFLSAGTIVVRAPRNFTRSSSTK